jgi:hypothetical protein
VNRWQTWAQQLRRRHGRRDELHASAAMVIASRPGSLVQIRCAAPRTIVHLHTHLRVSHVPAPRLLGPRFDDARSAIVLTARASSGTAHLAEHPDVRRDAAAAAPADRLATSAFLTVAQVRERQITTEHRSDRHVVSLHDLVRQWQQLPAERVRALELITRVRVGTARQEFPVPERAGVVARLRPPVAEIQHRAAPPAFSSSLPNERMPSPAAIAPVSVEALTTQVIQQLDRRLIAYRERMGRA